jgi:hypothetical protein
MRLQLSRNVSVNSRGDIQIHKRGASNERNDNRY